MYERTVSIDAIRSPEGETDPRRLVLSFSSEEPYRRWYGLEILDHADAAVNLERLNTVGVLLFNHEIDAVLGRVERAWIENRRGYAEVVFDDDDEAERIYQKVINGTLKTTSVRYTVDSTEDVSAGSKSADGFVGPCTIVRSWTPLEVSIVSVPADATVGVGRSECCDLATAVTPIELYERQIQVNKNIMEVAQYD